MKILIAGVQMPDNMGPKYVESFKTVFPKVAEAEKTGLLPFLLEGVGGDKKAEPGRPNPSQGGGTAENCRARLDETKRNALARPFNLLIVCLGRGLVNLGDLPSYAGKHNLVAGAGPKQGIK